MRAFTASVLVLLAALLAGGPVAARPQHDTAADIEDGGRVFRNTCANCHGPDGDEVAGIDLGRGQFRRAMTDQDLVQIIRNGIPGTPMPASNFSEEQAEQVVAYLRSVAAARRSASGRRRRSIAARRCSTARARARRATASTAAARDWVPI